MSKNIIRIRFLSLNDAVEEPVPNILIYLKKLTQASTSDASRIQLDEKSFDSSVVLSFNEPYDLTLDDEFFQILFLESKDEPKVITDIIFYRHYLLDLLNSSVQNDDLQRELFFYASLEQKRILKYSLQFVPNKVKKIHRKMVDRQPIRGHLMVKYQFNEPVYCAICNKFIVGLRLQGYRCERCSLVTHQKCVKRTPFWCQKSLNPMPCHYTGNGRLEYHPAHFFKRYEPSFLPSITPCKNCGSHVSGNGLKCEVCRFIIHKRCELSVPPMCGISYKARANALERDLIQVDVTGSSASNMSDKRISQNSNSSSLDSSGLNTTGERSSNCSNTSSIDVRWLEPLPQGDLTDLPKFSDFECIGRLGTGQYSSVYCARHNQSEKYVAIKVIDGSIECARDQFEVERQILFRYSQQNPYMIKGYCSFHQGCTLFLVMEFVGDDTLKEKIQKTRMNENEIRYYLAEIISVIQYVHSNKIVHRDLKLEHILVSSDGHIRLVDFGLGRILNSVDEVCHTVCGTDTYMSPEVRRLEKDPSADGYNYPVDYWAIGIMLVQLLCGEQLDFYDEDHDLLNFAENLPSYRHISAEARSLVRDLLDIDPKKRLGSANSPHGSIRDHPFFKVGKEMDWDEVDDGVLKPIHDPRRLTRDLSIESTLPMSSFDRGNLFNREWTNAGQSVCTPHEEQQYKSFDYINRLIWNKFINKNQ